MKRLSLFAVVSAVLLAPVLAFAQEAAPPLQDDLGGLASLMLSAITGKNWPLLASVAIVLLVALFRRLGALIPSLVPILNHPVVAWLLPTLTAVGAALITAMQSGTPLTFGLILNAIVTALAANGIFNGVKKVAEAKGAAAAAALDTKAEAVEVLKGGPQA